MTQPPTKNALGIGSLIVGVLLSWAFVLLTAQNPPRHSSPGNNQPGPGRWELDESTPDSDCPGDDQDPDERRREILAGLGVNSWYSRGDKGHGVKVAILDSGFCGYRAHLGHALPSHVTARSFRPDGNLEAKDSQHGILCAEVIHTLAPEADLLLANWEGDQPEQFLDAVRWAKAQGAHVISCSVIMPTWSDGEGGGNVHQELTKILGNGEGADDQLMFASAGNTALRHWGGTFHDGGNGWHDWGQGRQENRIHPWGCERISLELCCPPGSRYELRVEDITARTVVGRCGNLMGEDRCCCVVRFTPQAGRVYTLKVRQVEGKAGKFHLVALGGGLQISSKLGSIPFPGDGPEVIAVGAVNREGHRLAYSSCGQDSACPKPEFVASIPFPSHWRTRPFTGTSAAAPQAAALAALVWSRHPDWTPHQVRETLQSGVNQLGAPPFRYETGYGHLHLP
jgi:Subtilase family